MDLAGIDKALFGILNYRISNPVFDAIMPFIRNQHTWSPFYLFMLVFILVNFKSNTAWWVFFAAGTVILSDFISSDIIKDHIFRLRPCNDPALAGHIHVLVNYRPQSSSFTSSHATNHFAMASFFYYTLRRFIGKWSWLFFGWAFLICFAQVYVGVHYPFDVASGGAIGFVLGYLSASSFNKNYGLVRAI
jgi:undecaprenyl-diphosphatase